MDEIKCVSFSDAMELLRAARSRGLIASYWPRGGEKDSRTYVPVTHNVLVIGTQEQIKELSA